MKGGKGMHRTMNTDMIHSNAPSEITPLLRVENLCKSFDLPTGETLKACDSISLTVDKGKSLGIVGESGSGKTTLMKMMMQLIPASSGSIYFKGHAIECRKATQQLDYHHHIQMVFQDSTTAFDPRMKIADILCEPLYNQGLLKGRKAVAVAADYLAMVELPPGIARRYPHELSGGQRQRIAIARALVANPDIIIFDEATSALDVSVQDAVARLLVKLQKEHGYTYIFVAHDIAFVRCICHKVAVMHKGKLVDYLDADELVQSDNPYTRRLIQSVYEI